MDKLDRMGGGGGGARAKAAPIGRIGSSADVFYNETTTGSRTQ